MKSRNANLASILALFSSCIFLISCGVDNKIHTGAFNTKAGFEDTATGNYLVKDDGSKVYGKEIIWKTGPFTKDIITIDGQKFNISEIRGYKVKTNYYARIMFGKWRSEYVKRIVKGKLNIYLQESVTYVQSTGGSIRKVISTHYIQHGEEGQLSLLKDQKTIAKSVSDCPKAVEMVTKSSAAMRKAIRANPNYLNTVFELYNNNCNSVSKN